MSRGVIRQLRGETVLLLRHCSRENGTLVDDLHKCPIHDLLRFTPKFLFIW